MLLDINLNTIEIITIGIGMLGTICGVEIIIIRKKSAFLNDQYNACINSFLIMAILEMTYKLEVVS